MSKRIHPDAKVAVAVRMPHSLREQIYRAYAESYVKGQSQFISELIRAGLESQANKKENT